MEICAIPLYQVYCTALFKQYDILARWIHVMKFVQVTALNAVTWTNYFKSVN